MSRAKIAHHPIHPMLIVFPIGLWIFSFVCYSVFMLGGPEVWRVVAIYAMGGGIIGAALAAVPGMIDLFSMNPSKARSVGIWHMLINVSVLTLFAVAFFLHIGGYSDDAVTYVISAIAVLLLLVSGWLGGELVYVYGVATRAYQEAQEEQGGK